MANYTTYSDFYKVSFITTKSINIPKLLKQTGGLIVMSNTDDFKCTVNPDHGSHHPKSLWFRGEMIASGYGALCEQERNNLTYLAGAYDVIFGGIDKGFTDLSFWVNSYYGEFQNAMSYAYGEIDRVKQESYSYTNAQIKNLIGCAPDTLDTLGEIAHWLEHDKQLGLDTVSHVKEIASSYVWYNQEESPSYWTGRAPIDTTIVRNYNKYSYIGEYGWDIEETVVYYGPGHIDNTEGAYLVQNPSGQYVVKVPILDETGNHTYVTNEDNTVTYLYKYCSYDPGMVSTSFDSFTTVYSGIIAMKDYQMSTHYNTNPTLGTVLDCILDPYPYTKPQVSLLSYTPTYFEIGKPVNVSIDYEYKVNDAETLSMINTHTINATYMTSGIYTDIVSVTPSVIGLNNIGSRTTYTYNYTKAKQQYYPQLLKAGIQHLCDDGKWLVNGSGSGIYDIKIYGLLKIYSNVFIPGNITLVPKDKEGILQGNSEYIYDWGDTDKITVNMGQFTFNENHDTIWYAVPTSHYNYHAYIKNIHSGIMTPLDIKNSNDNNILLHYVNATNIPWYGDILYTVYYLSNNRTTMANDYELVIELTKK